MKYYTLETFPQEPLGRNDGWIIGLWPQNNVPRFTTNLDRAKELEEALMRAFIGRLKRNYPQVIEAMKILNISYQQYLDAMRAVQRQPSISTDTGWPVI